MRKNILGRLCGVSRGMKMKNCTGLLNKCECSECEDKRAEAMKQ